MENRNRARGIWTVPLVTIVEKIKSAAALLALVPPISRRLLINTDGLLLAQLEMATPALRDLSVWTLVQSLSDSAIAYKCPGFSTPYPSARFPQKCNIMDLWACGNNQCMPSNIPNVHICCQSTIRQRDLNPCPSGWTLNNDIVTFCTPSFQSSTCPGYSSCLRSSSVQQQFVCCIPS
ncbi:hypothetical protein OESDEN_16077 [Oesophagostomum dentatum]|uniref:Uncharacterized protein n=1 Tax=Oesophagostomum dentatum TaxID=61180 RepID=A0A0B1SL30_OESDE|nr:hypothetical protein OESDEN_16077 [Oesophagostomum dentatum]